MRRLRRMLAKVLGVFGRYESAVTRWGERSLLPATVQDARFDADKSTRIELVRRSRYWERNSAIVNRLADLFEQYTVGTQGLQFVCASFDEDWNAKAQDWWAAWCKFPDIASRLGWGTVQSLVARTWFVDGESFIHLTQSADSNRPRVEVIEAHRVATPPNLGKEEGKTVIDGIQINADGRPIGYWVRDGMDSNAFSLIPAEFIVHIYEPSRPGQYRGLPMLYPVMNDLHDLEDLQTFEMRAAKQAADISNVVKNAAGEADPATLRRMGLTISSENQAGRTVVKQRDQYFQTTLGGRTVYLQPGEDIAQFQSTRPSVTTQQFWDYITTKICAGVGISKLLVMPYSVQGTVVRSDLDTAAAFFRSRSAILAQALTRVYEHVMKWAIQYDKAVSGAPADWYKVAVRPPRSVNVDVGRNSRAMLDELSAGTRNFQNVYLETGEDWRNELEQRAKEAAFIRSLGIKYGIDPAEISTVQADKVERVSTESARKEDEMDVVPPDSKPKEVKE